MNAIFSIAFALFLTAPLDHVLAQAEPEVAAPAPTVEEIVTGVQAYYESVDSYHADFSQTYRNIALADEMVSTGHVYFRKPGRMRWDYLTPTPRQLFSNGQTLWAYEPEFEQYAEMSLSEDQLPIAIRFMMGEGSLNDDFDITMTDCAVEDAHCLELIPRAGEGQYRALEFVVDPETFRVRETTVVDPIGNRNHFVFTNPSTSDDLPIENFEFHPTPEMRRVGGQ
jgi:outer membrane lipoprotein carrier protein